MTVGVKASQANTFLDTLLATVFVKLHTGDPGAAGTSNASANTTRVAATFGSAAAGVKAMTGTAPSWSAWASGSETLTHISFWDASTGGNFIRSAVATTPKSVTNGDAVALNSYTDTFAPLAA